MSDNSEIPSAKLVARLRMTLTARTVDTLQPRDSPYIAWDDSRLTGFGVRVHLSGLRSYFVNYRADDRGRMAPNRRIVIGRHGLVTADQARRRAREILGRVALGEGPLADRARTRSMPTLRKALENWLTVGPRRRDSTVASYRRTFHKDLGGWLDRSLDEIDRSDVERRFQELTERPGWVQANAAMKLLSAIYRRPCLNFDELRNQVEHRRDAGGHKQICAEQISSFQFVSRRTEYR